MTEHRARLDEVISSYAQGWTLDRMPAVDRNVLRMATFEVLFVDDVPSPSPSPRRCILVRDLSTDESPPSSTAFWATSSATGTCWSAECANPAGWGRDL